MRQSALILSFCASLALAQNNDKAVEVPFIFPGGAEGVGPVADILTANPSTTVMLFSCPTGVDSTECGWGPGIRYTIVSTTIYQASFKDPDIDATMTFKCDHTSKAMVTCDYSVGGKDAEFPVSSTIELPGDVAFATATVTKGAEKLAIATDGEASAPQSTGPSPTGSAPTGSAPEGSAPSNTESGSPAEKTGAAYRFGVEGSALLALAGAAALNAW